MILMLLAVAGIVTLGVALLANFAALVAVAGGWLGLVAVFNGLLRLARLAELLRDEESSASPRP
jgi:hypothetical protein